MLQEKMTKKERKGQERKKGQGGGWHTQVGSMGTQTAPSLSGP